MFTLPDATAIAYDYDADGRRISQSIDGQVTDYLWDEASPYGDVVLETDGSGSTLASYVLGGTQLISQTRSGTTSYYPQDGQGSTRALTNDSGALTDTYDYTAFGELFNQTGATANSYLYTGQQFDSLTGLYSLRARYYNPALGRFLSQDTYPVDFSNPVELNRYVYVANSPINAIDPSGQGLIEYLLSNVNSIKNTVATFGVGVYGAVLYYYLLALNTPWIATTLTVASASIEVYLGYRMIFLQDQDAAFYLLGSYQLTGYSTSALASLYQQRMNYAKYLNGIRRALEISRRMAGKTPEELATLAARNHWPSPQRVPYRGIDQWVTRETLGEGLEIEIRVHEGLPRYQEFGWLGRVSLNSTTMGFFPSEVQNLVKEPSEYSNYYQLYVGPLVGGPVAADDKIGHFPLSPLITLINGREWFRRVFSILGQ